MISSNYIISIGQSVTKFRMFKWHILFLGNPPNILSKEFTAHSWHLQYGDRTYWPLVVTWRLWSFRFYFSFLQILKLFSHRRTSMHLCLLLWYKFAFSLFGFCTRNQFSFHVLWVWCTTFGVRSLHMLICISHLKRPITTSLISWNIRSHLELKTFSFVRVTMISMRYLSVH